MTGVDAGRGPKTSVSETRGSSVTAVAKVSAFLALVTRAPLPTSQHEKNQVIPTHVVNHITEDEH